MKLNIAQVIGLNTDQKAAQVISSLRDGGDNSFLAVLNLTCDDAFTKGRQILSDLSDFYFDFEGSPSEKLNGVFEEAKKKFAEGEYSILLSGISGKVLYLMSKGEVEVYLKRGEKLRSLLTVGLENQLISGFIQPGDKLLLSTKSLITFLGEDLDKSFDLSLDDFEGELSDRIGVSNTEEQGLAGMVLEAVSEETGSGGEEGIEEVGQSVHENLNRKKPLKLVLTGIAKMFHLLKGLLVNYFPRSGRGRLIVAVVLIIIIGLGVGFKIKASREAFRNVQFSSLMQKANDDFNGAKGLASLNPVEAKVKIDSAKSGVTLALTLKSKDNSALALQKQINDESGSILQQSQTSNFPVFLDLELVKKNFRAEHLSLSSGKLLILDPTVGTLITIDLSKKSNQIQAGSDKLGDASKASLNGDLAFVYSKEKGILRVDIVNQKVITVAKPDKDWGEIKDLYGFAGNVYVLDTGKNMIWKYLPTSEGYSDKRAYLVAGLKMDFSGSIRMQIESSIYILKSGGEILRFTKGEKDNFGLQGLDKNLKDPKSIFISSDTDNLYVLDSGNSRLLILTKTGSYKGQISGDEFGKASDLVVDEKAKKVYLLDGGKIFQVDLK